MELTPEELEQKRLEVIAKFNKKFIEDNLSIDAHTYKAVELLTRGINPYEIIEHLIDTNQKLFSKLVQAHSFLPPQLIIIDKANDGKIL